ncbi:transcription initiation factor TFIID subunit 4B isoform X2 [Sigmodon hispidus]
MAPTAALGPVTKAPVSVCLESVAPQPVPSPVGMLMAKVVPVTALPKLSGSRLPAPQIVTVKSQIVTVKSPGTMTIQLPANLQLPPGKVFIKSNSGQLMLVSPQQAVTGAKTTSNITPRPAVPANTQIVKICTVPNSSSQLIKKATVTPINNLTQIGTTVATTASSASSGQDAEIEAKEFTRKLYIKLKSAPQLHLIPFLKKSVVPLRQLHPNSQSFIENCVQEISGEVVIASCSTTATMSPVVTSTVSLVFVSGATAPRTMSAQTLSSLSGSRGANTGVVILHSVAPAAVTGGTTAATVVLQTSKPLTTSVPNTVTTVSLQPEKPAVSGTAVTLTLLPVTFGETSAAHAPLCLPSVKPAVTSAGTKPDKPITGTPVQIKLAQPGPLLSHSAGIPQAIKVKQLVVQQPSGGNANQVTTISNFSTLTTQKCGPKLPANTVVPTTSIIKQITLPGNKLLSLQTETSSIQNNKIKENGATCFTGEDDINDVTCMAEVNLDEENACILATHSGFVGILIQSCKEEPFLFIGALQKKILDIGKKHDIMELNPDAVNLISYATQERLRGLLEKLTIIAQHRMTVYKGSENYILSTNTRSQLKFLEKLDQLQKQRKDLEEREMLLRAAKSHSNKEDPEQLRLKQKAKEL